MNYRPSITSNKQKQERRLLWKAKLFDLAWKSTVGAFPNRLQIVSGFNWFGIAESKFAFSSLLKINLKCAEIVQAEWTIMEGSCVQL